MKRPNCLENITRLLGMPQKKKEKNIGAYPVMNAKGKISPPASSEGKGDESIFSCHTGPAAAKNLTNTVTLPTPLRSHLASHFTLKALFHTNNLPMTEDTHTHAHHVSSG